MKKMFNAMRSAALQMESSTELKAVREYLYLHMRSKYPDERREAAEAMGASALCKQWLREDFTERLVKTASPNASITSLSNISNFAQILARFLGANSPRGAFDSMKPDMQQVPLRSRMSCDAFFLSKLGAQEIGESGGDINPSWSLVLNDIEELLREVQTGEASKLWLILTPRACKYLARLATENAVTTLGWAGGTLMGVNVIASSQQTQNRLTLIDASAVVYADDGVEIFTSDQATVEMSDAPTQASDTPTATNLVSLWQTNCRAIRAERRISVRVVDTLAVASLSGAQWGIGSDSPSAAI
jgi:hypothetical protein